MNEFEGIELPPQEPATEVNALGQEVRVDRFERFRRHGAYYAFIQAPVALLNTQVPEGVAGSKIVLEPAVVEEDGTEVKPEVSRQKYIGEFILDVTDVPDSPTVVGSLSWMEAPVMRTKATPRYEMENWESFLYSYGITIDKWLTIEEMKAVLNPAKDSELEEA